MCRPKNTAIDMHKWNQPWLRRKRWWTAYLSIAIFCNGTTSYRALLLPTPESITMCYKMWSLNINLYMKSSHKCLGWFVCSFSLHVCLSMIWGQNLFQHPVLRVFHLNTRHRNAFIEVSLHRHPCISKLTEGVSWYICILCISAFNTAFHPLRLQARQNPNHVSKWSNILKDLVLKSWLVVTGRKNRQ